MNYFFILTIFRPTCCLKWVTYGGKRTNVSPNERIISHHPLCLSVETESCAPASICRLWLFSWLPKVCVPTEHICRGWNTCISAIRTSYTQRLCEEDYFAFSCQTREAVNREASAEFFMIKQTNLICQTLVMIDKKVNICTFGLGLAVSSVLIEAVFFFLWICLSTTALSSLRKNYYPFVTHISKHSHVTLRYVAMSWAFN